MNGIHKQTLGYAAAGVGLAIVGRSLYRQLTACRLAGKAVLITGGSRGLGLVMARQLARQGAKIAFCARDVDELQRAEAELACYGVDFLPLRCDVTQRDQVQEMVGQIIDHWGAIDVVINNAGVIQTGPLETMTLDDYDQAMKTHFYAPLYINEAVLPHMRRQRAGRIVNIASIGGRVSVPHMIPYSASKFALVGYSLGLRSELAKEGIVVTTICPGLMRTGSPRNALFKGQHRAEYAWFKISDSLPVISMNAERAARKVIDACRHGDAFVVLGAPIKVAEKFASLSPGLTSDALAAMDWLLPKAGGVGKQQRRGADSESAWSESQATALTSKAAVRNNET